MRLIAAILLAVGAALAGTGTAESAKKTADEAPKTVAIGKPADLGRRPDAGAIRADAQKLEALAAKMPKPGPSDWLAQHREAGQTFAEYLRSNPNLPTPGRQTIDILPLGTFSARQLEVVRLTADYFHLYFGLPVRLLPAEPVALPAGARRINENTKREQWLTSYLRDTVLAPRVRKDTAALIAFTATDLWPGEGWNFVFGEASLRDRVGVWSLARFGDPSASDAAFRICLDRTLRTATHETGHMFGIPHCTAWACNMNGSNSLAEADREPRQLCPECQAKIWWAMAIPDRAAHLRGLADFLAGQELGEGADYYRAAARRLTPAADKAEKP
jgi:archaemetzincin